MGYDNVDGGDEPNFGLPLETTVFGWCPFSFSTTYTLFLVFHIGTQRWSQSNPSIEERRDYAGAGTLSPTAWHAESLTRKGGA
ncbi:hypothetical protein EJB05_25116, partial [Eragrostis curvula]